MVAFLPALSAPAFRRVSLLPARFLRLAAQRPRRRWFGIRLGLCGRIVLSADQGSSTPVASSAGAFSGVAGPAAAGFFPVAASAPDLAFAPGRRAASLSLAAGRGRCGRLPGGASGLVRVTSTAVVSSQIPGLTKNPVADNLSPGLASDSDSFPKSSPIFRLAASSR